MFSYSFFLFCAEQFFSHVSIIQDQFSLDNTQLQLYKHDMADIECNPFFRVSLEDAMRLRDETPPGETIGGRDPKEALMEIEQAAHWVDRIGVSSAQSFGPLHKLNSTEREASWLSEVSYYAERFSGFYGMTREEYMEMVLERTGIPIEKDLTNVLIDPNIPINVLLKTARVNLNGLKPREIKDTAKAPDLPYVIKYKFMMNPREYIQRDDDGFLINKEDYEVPAFISPDFAKENLHKDKGFRGATLREAVFIKMHSGLFPYQSTFLALESRLGDRMLTVSDSSRVGKKLHVVEYPSYEAPNLWVPMVKVARKR